MSVHEALESLGTGVRHTLDAAAGAVALGALFNVLPKIAAALSILWLCVQMYDRFFGRNRTR